MADFTIGDKLKITLFGQSHGPAIGCVVDGFPAGKRINWEAVNTFMARRAPGQNAWSTPRKEADALEILSGLNADGLTCGAPLAAVIRNTNQHSGDYPDLLNIPRPGHADYTAGIKYGHAWDYRGGGQFSGRLTAPLCFAGALCLQWLEEKSIHIAAHIARVGTVFDELPDTVHPKFPLYEAGAFPVIDAEKGKAMQAEIEAAKMAGDNVDGAVRCIVTGFPAGVGGPYFGGLEGKIAQALFGIPAVKGIQFGDTQHHGSENNDAYCIENGTVSTVTNHGGGILGGISSGMPLHFTVSFKPTPSIAKPQKTVDLQAMEEKELNLRGRHDPCVIPRAVPVVEAVTAIVLTDLLLQGA